MSENLFSTEQGYTASVIVSPMLDGEEAKDQDRARFFGPGQSACLCDGVTSSPHAVRAAELITAFLPILFHGDTVERLRMVCDLLMALRQENMAADDVSIPPGVPQAMREMLRNVVQVKKADGFQTTIVAAHFTTDRFGVSVEVIKCGDSALFAFSPQGELLASSLRSVSECQSASGRRPHDPRQTPHREGTSFGPGDEILVRIEGPLAAHKNLAQAAGIRSEHLQNWIVCAPVECSTPEALGVQSTSRSLWLARNDRLLVPRYLYGKLLTSGQQRYLALRYSSCIRATSQGRSPERPESLATGGSSTLVLPDHFYSRAFECFQDAYPPQTHFLLCSDGFYGAFAEWSEMYQWLRNSSVLLSEESRRTEPLQQLHAQLKARKGDDDISFIWVQPQDPPMNPGEPTDVRRSCRTLACQRPQRHDQSHLAQAD